MSGKWKLNGIELGTTNATVLVTAHRDTTRVRQGREAIHGGTEFRERLGKNLVNANITFVIVGLGNDKYREAQKIIETLEDEAVWTLQSPDCNNDYYLFRAFRRAAFSTDSVGQTIATRSRLEIPIDAIVNGVWIEDGGTFCESITGHFEFDGTDYTRDDGTNTGTTPLLRLPEQSGGYPLAVRASDYALAQPTQTTTESEVDEDGNTVFYDVYDMTGFLVPAPTSAGDVGLYEVCSSPTDGHLGHGELLGAYGGVGYEQTGSFQAGVA